MSDISVNDCIYYTMIALGLIVIIFLLVSLSCSKNNEYFSRQNTRSNIEKKVNNGVNDVTSNKTSKNLITDREMPEQTLSSEEIQEATNMGKQFIADAQRATHKGHERDDEVVPYQDGPDPSFQEQNENREKQLNQSRLHSVARLGVGQVGPSYSQLLSKIYIPKIPYLNRYDDENPHTVLGESYDSFVYSDMVPNDYSGALSSIVSLSLRNSNGTLTAFGELMRSLPKIKAANDSKQALEDTYNEIIKDNPMISSKHVEVFIQELVKKDVVDDDTAIMFTMNMIKMKILNVISIIRLLQSLIKSNVVGESDVQQFILSILNELSVDDKILLLTLIVENKQFAPFVSLKYAIQYAMKEQIPFEKMVKIVSGYLSNHNRVESIISTIQLLQGIAFFNKDTKNIAILLNKIYASHETIIKVLTKITTTISEFAEIVYNMDFTHEEIIDLAVDIYVVNKLNTNDVADIIVALYKLNVYPDLMKGANQFINLIKLSESDKNIVIRLVAQKSENIETFLPDMGMISIPGISQMDYDYSKQVITDVSDDPIIDDIDKLEKEIEAELAKN